MLVKIVEAAEVLERDGEEAAIKFAAGLKCLGDYREPIQRAHSARLNPDSYRGMGKDPQELFRCGLAALRELIAAQGKAKGG